MRLLLNKEFWQNTIRQKSIPIIDFAYQDGLVSLLLQKKYMIAWSCLQDTFSYLMVFFGPFLIGNFAVNRDYNSLYILLLLLFLDNLVFFVFGYQTCGLIESYSLTIKVKAQDVLMHLDQSTLSELSSGEAITQIDRGSSSIFVIINMIRKVIFSLIFEVVILVFSMTVIGMEAVIIAILWISFNFACSYWTTSLCNKEIRPLINAAQDQEKQNIVENISNLVYIRSTYFADIKLDNSKKTSQRVHYFTFLNWRIWQILVGVYYFVSMASFVIFAVFIANKLEGSSVLATGIIINLLIMYGKTYSVGLSILEFQKSWKNLSEHFEFMQKYSAITPKNHP